MNLELMAMRWLRFEQKCMIVIMGRTPREICGLPDVLGVNCNRFATEVEIKRSMADFRADGKKRCRTNRDYYIQKMPKHFYYLVPKALSEKVLAELPSWAGLLTVAERGGFRPIRVIQPSPVNKQSERYTIKECVRLAQKMGNQIISSEESRESIIAYTRPYEPYWQEDYSV